MKPNVLITGAAGAIGSYIRPKLLEHYGAVRLLDIRPIEDMRCGEEAIIGDVGSATTLDSAMEGIDRVLHLAGIPREAPWPDLLRANIDATVAVFEAARRNKVRRVVFASSHHATSFTPLGEAVSLETELRPSGLYGVSKIFGEAIGNMYARKHGLEVVCLRIAVFRPAPSDYRGLLLWLSPLDMAQLAVRSLDTSRISFLTVYGVSNNKRNPYDRSGWDQLGYEPLDDSEQFVGTSSDLIGVPTQPSDRYCGGMACLTGPIESKIG